MFDLLRKAEVVPMPTEKLRRQFMELAEEVQTLASDAEKTIMTGVGLTPSKDANEIAIDAALREMAARPECVHCPLAAMLLKKRS